MLDRTIAPPIRPISIPPLPNPDIVDLGNGSKIYLIRRGKQEVTALSIATRTLPHSVALSSLAMALLKGGTTHKTSAQLNEEIESLGATLSTSATAEYAIASAASLTRFMPATVNLLKEAYTESTFPGSELALQKQQTIQNLQVRRQQTAVLASEALMESLYGSASPYGHKLEEAEVEGVDHIEVKKHFHDYLRPQSKIAFLAGNFTDAVVQQVASLLSDGRATTGTLQSTSDFAKGEKLVVIEKDGSTQTSIRMGKRTVHRSHPDGEKIMFAATVLGGYFGSRLMKNIREEKGLTYGIFARYMHNLLDGRIVIGADVNKENANIVVEEIEKEIEILTNNSISEDEFALVKNYLIGNLASSLDTAFNIGELIQEQVLSGLGANHLANSIAAIQSISRSDLQDTFRKYFQTEGFITVMAG